jgi:hypothetical protein
MACGGRSLLNQTRAKNTRWIAPCRIGERLPETKILAAGGPTHFLEQDLRPIFEKADFPVGYCSGLLDAMTAIHRNCQSAIAEGRS